MKTDKTVTIKKNGPYIVSGNIPLAKEISVAGKSGEPEKWRKGESYPKQAGCALCRCGKSANKPFCDGHHISSKFDGTETASKKKHQQQARRIFGPGLDLADAPGFCSSARFCHLSGGTWENVKHSNNAKSKKIAIQTACNCPSGRLVVYNKGSKKPIEPAFEPSIKVMEDSQAKVSGPLCLRGGITLISSDGKAYESRNRMTLCRCGKSENKPFCDGSHLHSHFKDGDKSIR